MNTMLKGSLYGGVLLLAGGAAWAGSRGSGVAARTAHEAHGLVASGVAQPVMLTADDARRIGVTYDVVLLAPVAQEIRTVGQVTYDETRVRTISLKVDGWVEELHVNFTGQAVAAGAPLLGIYSPMLVTAQEELLLAKRLEADVGAGAPDARAGAASLVAAARRRLGYWDIPASDVAVVERAGEVQRVQMLRAPVGGFVIEKNVQQGQRVMAGDALYRIADLRSVWVEGEVFERDLPSVRLGQTVTVELDAFPGRARSGRITYVYPTLNAETRTSRVRVELPNPGVQLKPGMYATLVWRGTAVSVPSVPRTAVLSTGQRHLVFVKRADGMLEPKLVATGRSTSDRVEILSGLTLGDTVVRSATFLVDAESNLATLLGGMGDMPGMDIAAPAAAGKEETTGAHANH